MSARLFLLSGKHVGHTYELSEAATMGRGEGCKVRLPDRSVSREHARLEPDGKGGWWLIDLGSRNGIKVNGERVERAALKDLDELLLGELQLRFRSDEPAAQADAPAPAAPAEPVVEPAPAPRPAPAVEEDDDAGFELEEDIELADVAPASARGRRPALATSDEPESEPEVELSDRDRARARILAESRGGGVMTGDLAQWPWPLRACAYLGAVLVMGGVFYGVYRVVLAMRGV